MQILLIEGDSREDFHIYFGLVVHSIAMGMAINKETQAEFAIIELCYTSETLPLMRLICNEMQRQNRFPQVHIRTATEPYIVVQFSVKPVRPEFLRELKPEMPAQALESIPFDTAELIATAEADVGLPDFTVFEDRFKRQGYFRLFFCELDRDPVFSVKLTSLSDQLPSEM